MSEHTELRFNEWMAVLDSHVWTKMGVSVHDLPDMSFRDWFDEGISPEQAVLLVAEAGF
jgi:hypothetical protein